MKYLVLGCGLQGRVIAYDLLQHDENAYVTVADIDDDNLEKAKNLIKSDNLTLEKFNIQNREETVALMSKADVIVISLPHDWETTEAVYQSLAQTNNKKVVFSDYWLWDKHHLFDEDLKKAKVLAVPGLGIAPGLANIMVGQLAHEFDQLEDATIYVGGLPAEKGTCPIDYMELFNVEAMLDMYLTPATVIEDGKLVEKDILKPHDALIIPGHGEVEVFYTDGLCSLSKTMLEKGVNNVCECTLRYPGHLATMKELYDYGFFSSEPIEINGVEIRPRDFTEKVLVKLWEKVPGIRDITYLYVVGKGKIDGKNCYKAYEVLTRSDEEVGITSMEIATAYPISVAALVLAYENIDLYGVIEPENVFVGEFFDKMVELLAERDMIVYEK